MNAIRKIRNAGRIPLVRLLHGDYNNPCRNPEEEDSKTGHAIYWITSKYLY